MSNLPPLPPGNTPPPPGEDPIQFDKVEYVSAESGAGAAGCAACNKPIDDVYYEVNGQIMCPECKAQLQGAVTGGSKTIRMLRAFLFGFVAMVVSSVAYHLVRKMTNAEWAIATIAMGWFIGWAVHRGARGRGGWFYQWSAVLLTYASIAFSFVPLFIEEFRERAGKTEVVENVEREEGNAGVKDDVRSTDRSATTASIQTASTDSNRDTETDTHDKTSTSADVAIASGTAGEEEFDPASIGPAEFAFVAGILIFALMTAPVFAVMESPILFIIYGFGLWQAARMNVRPKIVVAGPYSTRGGVASIGSTGATDDRRVV